MAQLDASLAAKNVTTVTADRADCYRIAVRLVRDAGYNVSDVDPGDILYVAQFLAGNDV
jgi:hypothetical protein